MVYPFDGSTFSTRKTKKQKVKKKKRGGLFSLRSKPFAVSSESFQYEHGSQLGNYSFGNTTKVSTTKRASIGNDVHYRTGMGKDRNKFSILPSSLRSKSGKKYLNSLSDAQFKFLYGSHPENTDSLDNSINPSSSDSFHEDQILDTEGSSVPPAAPSARTQRANPPILVSQGTFVSYNAPDATELHMIYTEDDFSEVYQRDPEFVPIYGDGRSQHSERSLTPRPRRRRAEPPSPSSLAAGSYSSEVRFIDASGRLVSYRLIRPKVKGAPVSAIVD